MDALVDTLSIEPRLALDTESDPFHRYYEKVCLIQISTREADYVFDPLVAGIPERLAHLLADRSRTFILHGADYDVRSLRRSFDLTLGKIFDTAIAANLLGKKELGLKPLLEKELAITIDKTEQRSDWGRRPLTDEQLAYAVADSRHLLPLADKLEALLADAGRLAWMEEECEHLRHREPADRVFDPEAYRNLTGARALGERGRRTARALFLWREDEARAKDLPPFRVLPNDALVLIAGRVEREGPLGAEVLSRIKRVPRATDVAKMAEIIVAGVEQAEAPKEPERERGDGAKRVDREVFRARMERLRRIRSEWSAKLGIDPGFLVSAAILERLAKEPPGSLEDLRSFRGFTAWRVDVVGPDLLAALRT
jgi:ribonuclease D